MGKIPVICMVLLGFLIGGCASIPISFKAPTTQMAVRTATFAAGYEIGKWDVY